MVLGVGSGSGWPRKALEPMALEVAGKRRGAGGLAHQRPPLNAGWFCLPVLELGTPRGANSGEGMTGS